MNGLKKILDRLVEKYNTEDFILNDPIQIPHSFSKKEDIEIAGFFASLFAWGKRSIIIKKGFQLMELMDNSPYDFVMHHSEKDLLRLATFKHRTINGEDIIFFVKSLRNIYENFDGLEKIFTKAYKKNNSIKEALINFYKIFFSLDHDKHSEKHISNVEKGSAAKRLNMFLMWLVRNDDKGVHFGLWKDIDKKDLMIPLDIHTGNLARYLGLLTRKQNDWKAVVELTENLKKFDPQDPVKYDFALFGADLNKDYLKFKID